MLTTPAKVLKSVSRYQTELNSDKWKQFARNMRSLKGNFCNSCRMGNKVTNVHHVFYDPDRQPWEYAADEVVILCEDCHKRLHSHLNAFRKHVFGKLSPNTFQVLNGALSVGLAQYDPLQFVHALAEFVSSPRAIENFSRSWQAEKPALPKLVPLTKQLT